MYWVTEQDGAGKQGSEVLSILNIFLFSARDPVHSSSKVKPKPARSACSQTNLAISVQMQRQQQGEGGQGLWLQEGRCARLSRAGEALLQGWHPPDDQLCHQVEDQEC